MTNIEIIDRLLKTSQELVELAGQIVAEENKFGDELAEANYKYKVMLEQAELDEVADEEED